MEFLYFLIWLLLGIAASFALIWLGLLFSSLKRAVDTFVNEIVPVINELEQTIKNVNSELERVEKAFEKIERLSSSVQEFSRKAEALVKPGLGRVATLYEATRKAIGLVIKNR